MVKMTTDMDILKDLTESLSEKDELIRKQYHQLQSILHASPVGICLVKNRIIQWSNPALAAVFNYTTNEMIALPILELYASRDEYKEIGNALYKRKDTDDRSEMQFTAMMVKKGGDKFRALLKVALIDEEPLTEVIAVIIDLVQMKKFCDEQLAQEV
jgi:PAS domain S-box-containing protein